MSRFAAVLAVIVVAQSASTLPTGWVEYTPKSGKYRAAFPARPTEVVRKVNRGGQSLALAAASSRKGAVAYTVACGELNALPADPQAVLDACRDEILRSLKGGLKGEQPIDLQGHPGRSIEIDIPPAVMAGGGKAWARIYLIGPQLFEITAVQPAKGTSLNPKLAETFLTSVRPSRVPEAEAAAAKVGEKSKEVPPGWTPYTSKDGTYSAAFPRPPRESQKENNDGGQRCVVTETSARGPKLGVFTVQCAEFPDAPPQTPAEVELSFDEIVQNMAREYGGKVVESEPVRLGDLTGRKARMEITPSAIWPKGGTLFIRLYMDERRCYTVTAIAVESVDGGWPLRFVDSFRVRKP